MMKNLVTVHNSPQKTIDHHRTCLMALPSPQRPQGPSWTSVHYSFPLQKLHDLTCSLVMIHLQVCFLHLNVSQSMSTTTQSRITCQRLSALLMATELSTIPDPEQNPKKCWTKELENYFEKTHQSLTLCKEGYR